MAFREHQFSGHNVFSQRPHVLIGGHRGLDLDGRGINFMDDLNHDDGIEPCRKWVTRIDPLRLFTYFKT
jgi:hypothetical protein